MFLPMGQRLRGCARRTGEDARRSTGTDFWTGEAQVDTKVSLGTGQHEDWVLSRGLAEADAVFSCA